MPKMVYATSSVLKNLTIGILCGAAVGILPVLLISHRHLDSLFNSLIWQKQLFFAICLIGGTTLYMRGALFEPKKPESGWVKLLPTLATGYLFCYTACAALCQKINLSTIKLPGQITNADMNSSLYSGADLPIAAWTGIILISLATIIQVAPHWLMPGLKTTKLYPIYWSCLLFMSGVSLVFSVWLPLIALPGIFIFLKWMDRNQLLTKR